MEIAEQDQAYDCLAHMIEMTPQERRLLAALQPLAHLTAGDFSRTFSRVLLEKQL